MAPSVVVKQPLVAGFAASEASERPGFGSTPVRTGFGTMPVNTGFGSTSVRTGFGSTSVRTGFGPAPGELSPAGRIGSVHVHPSERRDARARKGAKTNHGIAVVFIPVPYAYTTEGPFGFTTLSTHQSPFAPRDTRNRGVTAGPSTYWTDLSNQAGASAGLIFDVAPAAAEVYVDSAYAGIVQDFATGRDPLMVVPGTHRVELHAIGYHPVAFDVTLAPGQIIPFTGELDILRAY
jgi:hypothetical protein